MWKVPDEEIDRIVGISPDASDEPELFDENVDYLRAFLDLAPSRSVGLGGVGMIPISEIAAYWHELGIDSFETFLRRIRAADSAFLQWNRQRKVDRAQNLAR